MKLSGAAREALRNSRSRGGLIHGDANRASGDAIAVKELTITDKKKSGGSAGGRAGGKSAKKSKGVMRSGGVPARLRTTSKSKKRERPPQRVANTPVSTAPRPLRGKAKPGSGKEALMKEGAGQKMLKTWRSMNKGTKADAVTHAKSTGGGLKATIQGYREARRGRNVNPTTGEMGRNRRIAAGVTQPKAPRLPMGLTPNIKPRKKAK